MTDDVMGEGAPEAGPPATTRMAVYLLAAGRLAFFALPGGRS
jgi:hypothetical protein